MPVIKSAVATRSPEFKANTAAMTALVDDLHRQVEKVRDGGNTSRRVLKVGGHFLCLEFSSVDVPGLDVLYDLYSFNVVPALGRAVVGDAEPYRYLVESIRRFPKPEAFAAMIRDAGFRRVSYRPLSGGIVALHSGWRL